MPPIWSARGFGRSFDVTADAEIVAGLRDAGLVGQGEVVLEPLTGGVSCDVWKVETPGGPIVVKKGRYGPYVSHDGVNATLPNDITPETVTLEQAVSLIDARVAAGGGKKKSARGKAAKAPAKKGKAAKPAAEGKAEAVASTARRTAGRKVASGKAPAKAAAPKKPAAKPARKAKAAD